MISSRLTRSSSRRKFRERKATSETPHATLNLNDNIARYHTYTYIHIHTRKKPIYYIACTYDIFTLGYLKACTWRNNSRVRVVSVCQCHCASRHIASRLIPIDTRGSVDSKRKCPPGPETCRGEVSRGYFVASRCPNDPSEPSIASKPRWNLYCYYSQSHTSSYEIVIVNS